MRVKWILLLVVWMIMRELVCLVYVLDFPVARL